LLPAFFMPPLWVPRRERQQLAGAPNSPLTPRCSAQRVFAHFLHITRGLARILYRARVRVWSCGVDPAPQKTPEPQQALSRLRRAEVEVGPLKSIPRSCLPISVKKYPVLRPGSPFFTGKSGFGVVGIGFGMARGGGKIG